MIEWADKSQSVVLCEGYHDRQFWNGWLTALGLTDPGAASGRSERIQVSDPWGDPVEKGKYAFRSKSGRFVVVVPCRGLQKMRYEVRKSLRERVDKTLTRLVLNVDPDTDVTNESARTGLRLHDVLAIVKGFDGSAFVNADGNIDIDQGAVKVSLIRWECEDTEAPGVPNQQTLERLVCAALCDAFPGRGSSIKSWLDSRLEPPKASVKEFVWSHMAGWHAEHGCDDFYRSLWDGRRVAEELEKRLRASGAWHIAEVLAG